MPFLNDQDAAFVRKRLEQELSHDVTLEFFAPSTGGLTLPGQDAEIAEYTKQILTEVAQRFGITRAPATAVIGAEDYGVRFYGMPAGYEFATLLELIIDVSKGSPALAEGSKDVLGKLQEDAHIQVFVTPT